MGILVDADLSGATLSGANLSSVFFRHALLLDANRGGANLAFADLAGASLSNAELSGASNLDSRSGSAFYDASTAFGDTDFDPVAAGWIFLPEPNAAVLQLAALLGLVSLPRLARSMSKPSRAC